MDWTKSSRNVRCLAYDMEEEQVPFIHNSQSSTFSCDAGCWDIIQQCFSMGLKVGSKECLKATMVVAQLWLDTNNVGQD